MLLYRYMKSEIRTEIIALCCLLLILPTIALGQTVDELDKQISDKQTEIQQIKDKAATYQKNIRDKQNEAASLKNQLSILENKIAKTKLDIEATKTEIEQTQLSVRGAEIKILHAEDKIDTEQSALADILHEIHRSDQNNPINAFLLHDSISEYFNDTEYTKDLQVGLKGALDSIHIERNKLVENKQHLEEKYAELANLKNSLEEERTSLTGENQYKEKLLVDTKKSEQKFTELYWQAKSEQESISREIALLEKNMRARMDQLKNEKQKLTDSSLDWPVPRNTLTAVFHDPDYPFRYLFEHPAIDIRTKYGTPIKAPAEGYVLTAKSAGLGYSYIALIHADGISTVYGHVSKIFVEEDDYVARGTVIGFSGGTPGTPGAGRLSTGPHLHFEVRVGGIPVDPLNYLP